MLLTEHHHPGHMLELCRDAQTAAPKRGFEENWLRPKNIKEKEILRYRTERTLDTVRV